ncbi:MAG: hypothetical protein VKL39_14970 [Leptolyngbyaceae bacterium]|nr:hypothetical protein [Leptolyngbyaceae bacterium]
MVVSQSSKHFAYTALIDAQVTSLTVRATDLGDRMYAVFKTMDGSLLGFWSDADHPALRTLRVGDTVALKRNAKGHLTLAPQPAANTNATGIFALLLRPWRLL